MKGLILTALLTIVAWPAHAANIEVVSTDTAATITIEGDIGVTDYTPLP